MARKKPRFLCKKCNKNLGSAAKSYRHFKKNPTHRTERQAKDYKQNLALREKKGLRPIGKLPTVVRKKRAMVKVGVRYCTQCGNGRRSTHVYCGNCGVKCA
jgi:hypothetical protein